MSQALLLHPGGVPGPAPQRRPEHGGDRHHGRHRDPARRPDPDLPDDPGEERRGPRQPRIPGRALRRRDQGRNQRPAAEAGRRSRTSPRSSFISKAEALRRTRRATSARTRAKNCSTQLHAQPAAGATSRSRPTTPPTSTRCAQRSSRRARTASRSRSRRSSRNVFDRQQAVEQIEQVTERAEDRPHRDHRAADRSPR